MDPVTWVAIAVVAALGAGFGAGWGLRPDSSAAALEAQADVLAEQGRTLAALQAGQVQIVEAAGRPVVLDAELRSELAQVPVQCRRDAGGNPRSPECAWATCLQFGQSTANRPECRAVEALMLQALQGACKDAP
jgi:hypothetical protein